MAVHLQLTGRMLMHRPFATGLVGMACSFALLWQMREEPAHDCAPRPAAASAEAPAKASPAEARGPCWLGSPAVNVVDVAAGAATPELVAQLIRVAGDERVTSVDDHPVASDLAAGAWIAARFQHEAMDAGIPLMYPRGPIRRGDYIDLTIEGEACSRRVLVLFH